MAPKISVIMATYNHAPFVAQSVRSVLDQSFADFEFLISDDGSSDSTGDVVRRFSDPRLQFYPNSVNRGACTVTNELVQRASGDYVAVINSDDYWAPDKLAVQLDFLERHPDHAAHFTGTIFIDKAGAEIAAEATGFGDIFRQPNRPRGQWLRRFFDGGNCLCHPSILIRRRCYAELGPYDNRYRQLPDFDMWIRLLKRYAIHVADRRLVFFRLMPGENVSSHTEANLVRASNEHYLIACGYFDGLERSVLVEGFSDLMVFKDPPSPEHCEIEKALLYFVPNGWLGRVYAAVGLRQLFDLLQSPPHRRILIDDYGIDDLEFQRRTATANVFRQSADPSTVGRAALLEELKRRAFGRLRRQFRRLHL
jgi:glycosyltransferase involved in cell wall biosynthesis